MYKISLKCKHKNMHPNGSQNISKVGKRREFYLSKGYEEVFWGFQPQNLPLLGTRKAWRGLEKARERERGSGEEKG